MGNLDTKKDPRGRKPLPYKTEQLKIMIPEDLKIWLEAKAADQGRTRNKVLLDILRESKNKESNG